MKKILFTATVDSHILHFHLPYLELFKKLGYEVHVASNGNSDIPFVDVKHNVSFERSPYSLMNLKVYRVLKKILLENEFTLIHCHTPMGGVITRLAAIESRKRFGTKVLYTAHGFHFYKSAPKINWYLFYPIEKWLSKYTDGLITINSEDYGNTQKRNFKTKKNYLVNGVGVDLTKFTQQNNKNKNLTREEYGYKSEDFILFYAAELSNRKNQVMLFKSVNILKEKIPNLKLLLAGDGELTNKYKELVDDMGLNENVEFLGYRKDISKLMVLSDIAVSSSRQEGLPVNVMEAMGTNLPLVVTNCRGNRDLVTNNLNGYLVEIDDVSGLANAILKLYNSKELRESFGRENSSLIEVYSLEKIVKEMEEIYVTTLNE